MRRFLPIAAALAANTFAAAALAQSAPPAGVPAPPSASFPEFSGGANPGWTPNYLRDGLDPRPAHPKPIFAVVGGHVVTGMSQPDSASIRIMRLTDRSDPNFSCASRYRPSNEGRLIVSLACSDGSKIDISLHAFEDAVFGHTTANGMTASFSAGFRATYAAHRLVAPAGFELVAEQGQLSLKRAGA